MKEYIRAKVKALDPPNFRTIDDYSCRNCYHKDYGEYCRKYKKFVKENNLCDSWKYDE
jgi:hypothetical protein